MGKAESFSNTVQMNRIVMLILPLNHKPKMIQLCTMETRGKSRQLNYFKSNIKQVLLEIFSWNLFSYFLFLTPFFSLLASTFTKTSVLFP